MIVALVVVFEILGVLSAVYHPALRIGAGLPSVWP